MAKETLKIQGLNKFYGKFKALENVSMTIHEGDIYGLIGKNGAGKTTLFKQILGLSEYQQGSIELMGTQDLKVSRQEVGFYISPHFYGYMNAKDNLEYFRKLKGIEDKSEVDRVLKIVGLDQVDKKFKSFSMGMKQRLGIANAIMGSPKFVILDEPINGLDPQGIVDVRNLIKRLNTDYGMTLLISSHILNELSLIADRFGMIDNGKMLVEISREDIHNMHQTYKINTDTPEALVTYLNKKEIEYRENEGIYYLSNITNSPSLLKALILADVSVKEAQFTGQNLEEFYFSLTEGGIR